MQKILVGMLKGKLPLVRTRDIAVEKLFIRRTFRLLIFKSIKVFQCRST